MELPVLTILSLFFYVLVGKGLWLLALASPPLAALLGVLVALTVLAQAAEWYRIYYQTNWDLYAVE